MIYVADSAPAIVLQTRRMLYRLGLPSIGGGYRMAFYYASIGLCDAVLLPRPTSDGRPRHYCRSVRARFPSVPTAMLADHTYDSLTIEDPADVVVRAPYSPTSAMRAILRFFSENGYRDHGALNVFGLMHKITNGGFYYLGEYVKLTDTETAILHTMLDRFPSPLDPKILLKLSADPRKSPRLHTLSPHICRLNKRFTELFGFRPISYHPALGYYLSVT